MFSLIVGITGSLICVSNIETILCFANTTQSTDRRTTNVSRSERSWTDSYFARAEMLTQWISWSGLDQSKHTYQAKDRRRIVVLWSELFRGLTNSCKMLLKLSKHITLHIGKRWQFGKWSQSEGALMSGFVRVCFTLSLPWLISTPHLPSPISIYSYSLITTGHSLIWV